MFYFFKIVQNWFKHAGSHTISMLERSGDSSTFSNSNISKYLSDYESEYQYLFNKLQKIKAKEMLAYEDCISLPNECRRVLESIAVFKFPFKSGHDNRIKAIREEILNNYVGDKEILEQSLDYVYRYSNTESHLQLFDDGIYFHNNPNEAKIMIEAIISLIEYIAPEHLENFSTSNNK